MPTTRPGCSPAGHWARSASAAAQNVTPSRARAASAALPPRSRGLPRPPALTGRPSVAPARARRYSAV
eukprot:14803510-Alexandrium_andersonii.AAC.1